MASTPVKKVIAKIAPPLAANRDSQEQSANFVASPISTTDSHQSLPLSTTSSTHSDEKHRKSRPFSSIMSTLRKSRSASRGHSLDSRHDDDLRHIVNGAADVHPHQVSAPASRATQARRLSFTEQRELRQNEREEKEEEEAEQRRRRQKEAWEKVSFTFFHLRAPSLCGRVFISIVR
jgi:hypothetical protein